MTDPERHGRVVSALAEHDLDGFVCSLPSQVLLLTGYWPVMASSVALFAREGKVHLLIPEDEDELAARSSDAERTLFRKFPLDEIRNTRESVGEPLVELFRRMNLQTARLGIEATQLMQPASYTVMNLYLTDMHELLRSTFPNLRLVPSNEIFEHLKGVKTVRELEKIRTAARIAGAAFECASQHIGPGMREPEVASRFQSAFDQTPLAAAVQRSYGAFFCMSGVNAAKASAGYARTRQRKIEKGDLIMIHCNTCGDGFWTDITRTYTAGPPNERQQEMRSAIMEARQAALEAIAPGVKARVVDRAARSVLEAKNFGTYFTHSSGHGVGFAAANPNGMPRIHPESPDVLSQGMTFNIEPAIYVQGYGGMRHCDVLTVTDRGAEVLTSF